MPFLLISASTFHPPLQTLHLQTYSSWLYFILKLYFALPHSQVENLVLSFFIIIYFKAFSVFLFYFRLPVFYSFICLCPWRILLLVKHKFRIWKKLRNGSSSTFADLFGFLQDELVRFSAEDLSRRAHCVNVTFYEILQVFTCLPH